MVFATPPRTRTAAQPSREEVYQLFGQGDLVPVYRTLLADLETPVSVYMKLAQSGNISFLLESVEGGEQVGARETAGTLAGGDVADDVRQAALRPSRRSDADCHPHRAGRYLGQA
jgi:hypothetical protein